ncbi:hypothetical protein G6L89_010305 [Agrobacterium fabrum]|uniref:hypothetical protein n=1 Tax=Agrobacterium fabrum TaxID=1176649 RepID=UPI0015733769|nr:hypothetical protein [Agrobacterium fabrum]NTB08220.1 hypothetical protein [Agrobacterium fabrum]
MSDNTTINHWEKINLHIAALAKTISRSITFTKVAIILFGAISAVMQFWPSDTASISRPQFLGALAAVFVAILGTYLLFAERDASSMLVDANKALSHTVEAEQLLVSYEQNIISLRHQIGKFSELYVALGNARDMYEVILRSEVRDCHKLLQDLMTINKRQLAAAMEFQTSDRWTVCIYKSQASSDGSRELKIVAHIRAIECDMSEARVWPEGVGFSGIALSTGEEIIVGNLNEPTISQIYGAGVPGSKINDATTYMSGIACPIFVGNDKKPWGVATATNSRVDHFIDVDENGVQNGEAVRAIANMAAMIVALSDATSLKQET